MKTESDRLSVLAVILVGSDNTNIKWPLLHLSDIFINKLFVQCSAMHSVGVSDTHKIQQKEEKDGPIMP